MLKSLSPILCLLMLMSFSSGAASVNESLSIAEKVHQQITSLYHHHLKLTRDEATTHQIMSDLIERDLSLIAPELQDEFRIMAFEALTAAAKGVSLAIPHQETSELYQKSSLPSLLEALSSMNEANIPKGNSTTDTDKTEYKNKAEILASLASGKPGTRWIEQGGIDANSNESKRRDGNFSYRFKVKFLGVDLEAGPNIRINREVITNIKVIAEGQYPVTLPNGFFDLEAKDTNGKKIVKNGKVEKRFAAFFCEATFIYDTDYTGGGSFSIAGIGGGANVGRRLGQSVYMQSRRLLLPEFIANKQVTYGELRSICHNEYINARVTGKMTVRQVADTQIKAQLASMVFTHPKTKCLTDNHCQNWLKKEILPVSRAKVGARCVEDKKEKFRFCQAVALKGEACPVYQNGKKVSSSPEERICDNGLRCQVTKKAGPLFWQWAEARCQK